MKAHRAHKTRRVHHRDLKEPEADQKLREEAIAGETPGDIEIDGITGTLRMTATADHIGEAEDVRFSKRKYAVFVLRTSLLTTKIRTCFAGLSPTVVKYCPAG